MGKLNPRKFSLCSCCAFIFCLLWVNIDLVQSHVTLTFPPARKLSLDFLNSFWTKPPCGMPKGNTRTTLLSGSSFNINWHLGYAHKGGYKVELLDSREKKILDLSEKETSDGYVASNSTNQWHRVNLPADFTCRDCTIRLLRQVKSFDPKFNFWSCADVDIVNSSRYVENCSKKGSVVGGKCKCDEGYWGKQCQFEDECGSDYQCGNGKGKCIYLGGTNLPRKQCFCSSGYFGVRCSQRNSVKLPDPSYSLNLTRHTLQVLTERMILYYRVVPASNRNRNDHEVEFILLINGTSYGAIGWRPSNLGPSCKSWPFVKGALNEESNSISGRDRRRQSNFQSGTTSQWAAKDTFSKMDCTDMIIGAARGNYARIRDYYARGRHTPKLDTEWGGREDISAATGWEKDGVTTLIFRRKVGTGDGPDHALNKGEMLVIWSRGQEPGEYVSNVNLRLDRSEPRVPPFYVKDELKYHGIGPQRGYLYMDFVSKQSRVPGINAIILQ